MKLIDVYRNMDVRTHSAVRCWLARELPHLNQDRVYKVELCQASTGQHLAIIHSYASADDVNRFTHAWSARQVAVRVRPIAYPVSGGPTRDDYVEGQIDELELS